MVHKKGQVVVPLNGLPSQIVDGVNGVLFNKRLDSCCQTLNSKPTFCTSSRHGGMVSGIVASIARLQSKGCLRNVYIQILPGQLS
jgi:hypothetical protein